MHALTAVLASIRAESRATSVASVKWGEFDTHTAYRRPDGQYRNPVARGVGPVAGPDDT
jgi:hypothetical protein